MFSSKDSARSTIQRVIDDRLTRGMTQEFSIGAYASACYGIQSMGFLALRMTAFLVVAGVLAAALTYWWLRIRFVDRSDQYDSLLSENQALLARNKKLRADLMKTEELREVAERRHDATAAESRSVKQEARAAARRSFELREHVEELKAENEVLRKQIRILQSENCQNDQPAHNTGISEDLLALSEKNEELKEELRLMQSRLLDEKEKAIEKAGVAEHANASLARLSQKVDQISKSIHDSMKTDSPEAAVENPNTLPSMNHANGDQLGNLMLFSQIPAGPKDDLKRIRGIGTVFERKLNNLGVFYFWQIAAWSEKDQVLVETKLGSFPGRIAKSEWVLQASELLTKPGSVPPPPNVVQAEKPS